MKRHRLKHFDLDVYQETLSNGLLVNVVPKKGNNIYVTFITKYGSFDNVFIPYGKKDFYEAPMGVAHFLEHKVFEQSDGEDPFAFYTRNGADANASTSYIRTCYLFSGPDSFHENINYLLDFVQSPYFTEENVEKEKGIIEQEIKMYDDMPFWRLFEATLKNTFHNHPLRYPIAGTVETISKITKEDLYTCYNTFYHPSNMFLTVVGNVDPEEAMKSIRDNQSKKDYESRDKIILKEIEEPNEVGKEKEIIPFDVEIPKLAIAYKINIGNYDINKVKDYLSIYFNIKLDSTSLLREKLKKENAITGGFGIDVIDAGNHILCAVNTESKDPEYVIEQVDAEIKTKKITETELNRKKKTMKSGCIYQSDSVFSIASNINNNILRLGEVIFDEYEWVDSLNIEEMKDILANISFDEKSVAILKKS